MLMMTMTLCIITLIAWFWTALAWCET